MISAPSSSLFKAPLHEKFFLKAFIRAAARTIEGIGKCEEHTKKESSKISVEEQPAYARVVATISGTR